MGCDHNCSSCSENCEQRSLLEKPNKYSSIKKVIGIVSGKGGVGKSLVTSLLAVSLQQRNYKVGILDADITGPSIPKAFNITEPLQGNQFGTLPQKSSKGIQVVSTNLLLEDETEPVVWRGPVIANLVKQFWTDIIWHDVDFLLVDMPPGTSDVPLTVYQSLPIDGIIVVTSPQDLVSMIVEKALNMAKKMNVEVLGLVENMSYITCSDCGKRINVFGESKAEEIAKKYGIKLLAQLPIDPKLTQMCDKGQIESYDGNYLDAVVEELSNLPIRVINVAVAVNDDETINHHFGKCEKFILYTTTNQMIIGKHLLVMNELGHEKVVETLKKYDVHVVLGNHAGECAISLLNENKIESYFGLEGQADEVVLKYLYNELDDILNGENHTCGCNHDGCDCESHDDCSCHHDDCGCGHHH